MLCARGAGDMLSRGPSHTGEFALPSTALSSSPGQFATIDAAAPFSVYSNPPSLPASNPPSELHEEDDLAQATIGHSIAEATPHVNTSAISAAALAGPPDAALASRSAMLPDALTAQPGGPLAAATSAAVTAPLPLRSGSGSGGPGDQALPPTEVNIARHTHALAATVMPPPQQHKVGRFSVKKKQDPTTSDNGSAVTMPGAPLHSALCNASPGQADATAQCACGDEGFGAPSVSALSTCRRARESTQEVLMPPNIQLVWPSCKLYRLAHVL